MSNPFSIPRGTADILSDQVPLWQDLESKSRKILSIYGYSEIRTPIFEEIELFARSMGQTSDIVEKQMLTLSAQGEESKNTFALRPEGTAAIVRSYIENSVDRKESISKLYYIGPMFRGERPQKGRLRQFHQIGVEVLGPNSFSPLIDVEVISLSVQLLKAFGLTEDQFKLKINSLGTPEDKLNFSKILREKLKSNLSKLCPDCQNRFERNVFRILDCKNKDCHAIVKNLNLRTEHLSSESQKHFQDVQDALKRLNIQFEVVPTLVRGLDYYTYTVFEIISSSLGSQDALGAGGRYNHLVEQLGGSKVDCIGFALGMERILLALGDSSINNASILDCFLVTLDQPSLEKGFEILYQLRQNGISADMSYKLGSIKSQMRQADKKNVRFALLIGDNELKSGIVTVKEMQSGDQQTIEFGKLVDHLKKRIGQ